MSLGFGGRLAIALAALVTGLSSAMCAEPWPQRPLHVIVPFAAGSVTDIVPRIVFEQVADRIGQPALIENRPGGGGLVGAAAVAKSEPDGYTLLVTSSAHTVAPAIYSNMPFDPVRDFVPIIPIGMQPIALVAYPERFKNLDELVRSAKAAADRPLTFASTGVGSATHLAAERFRLAAGFEATHIPFTGPVQALTEVLARRVDYCFCAVGSALPFIQSGQLTALAVGNAKRMRILPDVPTFAEAGYGDKYLFWIGLLAPADTPADRVNRLYTGVSEALRTHAIAEKLTALGVEPMPMSNAEFRNFVNREIESNKSLTARLDLPTR